MGAYSYLRRPPLVKPGYACVLSQSRRPRVALPSADKRVSFGAWRLPIKFELRFEAAGTQERVGFQPILRHKVS
jgi:hypothetical protein